eukprot:TRINITY_DN51505_c0_g1_i1.p1 TRINITY_DN51505_c0_g1~~TRINITY_DN51505_c0_g1_i1.p1  ORF type:complete len:175 (-),score=16.37 TRINITY_DN51505_c0_g1_i1:573-1097(-)
MVRAVSLRGFSCCLLHLAVLFHAAAGTHEMGRAYLRENKKKTGVVPTSSGLQYKAVVRGGGRWHPANDTACDWSFEVYGIGSDVSVGDNITAGDALQSTKAMGTRMIFAPQHTLKGVSQAMLKMVEGDRWHLWLPSHLAYGDRGRQPHIQPGDALFVMLELLSIRGKNKLPKDS